MLGEAAVEGNHDRACRLRPPPRPGRGGSRVIPALACAAGLLGLVAGSFLNCVADRVPAGQPVMAPRAACPACGRRARVGDRVPLLSWLLRRGRCSDCGAVVSVRYPLVEVVTAAAFAGLVFLLGASWALPGYWWAAGAAIALTLTDLDHRRIPDRILVPGIIGAGVLLAAAALLEGDPWAIARALAGGAAYFGLLLVVALGARGGFGFGDVKLGLLLGVVLAYRSWGTLAVGAFAAFALGGLAAVILLIARRVGRKDAIPFGPAMVAGAALALACGELIARWYLG